ncbi:MAG: acetyl-CoA carboxylase carboxyl transferase subunit alpha, partial [Candidatus Margulisbacteria bacterium]|nr:acetyl-CoA carboxylase carboxyl transferase subunit alpha [Candidatus Margulisiibacteriota bacterium]
MKDKSKTNKITLLEFEKPLAKLYEKLDDLKRLSAEGKIQMQDDIRLMEKRIETQQKEIFSKLTPIQIVQVARHMQRPTTLDYIDFIFEDFIELHGDRNFSDDSAMISGIAKLNGRSIVVMGQQKGKTTKENIARNFGMANPEGYRKALRIMRIAERYEKPIISFIDTPGAYPGIGAEERGQAEAIAKNLREMAELTVPFISIVTGEGGSGGALG